MLEHHVTPEQAGEVFAKTSRRLAVYSHIVEANGTEQDFYRRTGGRSQGRWRMVRI